MRVELIGYLKAEAGSEYIEIKVGGGVGLVEALKMLPEKVRNHVIDEKTGEPVPGLLILVNGSEVKSSQVYGVRVNEDDTITLIPAIHGGCRL